jgi:asparagine synthase (glutamine-hydrolysing)
MANGVEVRVPFLDNDLASFAMSLPAKMKVKGGVKKYLLKKALHDILPHEVLYGPKKGFGVPYSNWLKGPIHEYLKSILHDSNIIRTGILNMTQINKAIEEHKAGKGDWGFILWKLLNFSIWLKTYDVVIENE